MHKSEGTSRGDVCAHLLGYVFLQLTLAFVPILFVSLSRPRPRTPPPTGGQLAPQRVLPTERRRFELLRARLRTPPHAHQHGLFGVLSFARAT